MTASGWKGWQLDRRGEDRRYPLVEHLLRARQDPGPSVTFPPELAAPALREQSRRKGEKDVSQCPQASVVGADLCLCPRVLALTGSRNLPLSSGGWGVPWDRHPSTPRSRPPGRPHEESRVERVHPQEGLQAADPGVPLGSALAGMTDPPGAWSEAPQGAARARRHSSQTPLLILPVSGLFPPGDGSVSVLFCFKLKRAKLISNEACLLRTIAHTGKKCPR